jgi:hypothetical protein
MPASFTSSFKRHMQKRLASRFALAASAKRATVGIVRHAGAVVFVYTMKRRLQYRHLPPMHFMNDYDWSQR